jgi:hypothetical protein
MIMGIKNQIKYGTIIFSFIIILSYLPNLVNASVGSNTWLEGVKHCVNIYHENNSTEDAYYDCMLELETNISSNDENNG